MAYGIGNVILSFSASGMRDATSEERLLSFLFDNDIYNPIVRPVLNHSHPVNIDLTFTIESLDQVVSFLQVSAIKKTKRSWNRKQYWNQRRIWDTFG